MSRRVTASTRIVTEVTFRPAATDAIPSPAPEDPTTVTLRVRSNAGVVTNYVYGAPSSPVTRTSQGVYSGFYTASADGDWQHSWLATGVVLVTTNPTKVTVLAGI